MAGEDFPMAGEDFPMAGEDFPMAGEDFGQPARSLLKSIGFSWFFLISLQTPLPEKELQLFYKK